MVPSRTLGEGPPLPSEEALPSLGEAPPVRRPSLPVRPGGVVGEALPLRPAAGLLVAPLPLGPRVREGGEGGALLAAEKGGGGEAPPLRVVVEAEAVRARRVGHVVPLAEPRLVAGTFRGVASLPGGEGSEVGQEVAVRDGRALSQIGEVPVRPAPPRVGSLRAVGEEAEAVAVRVRVVVAEPVHEEAALLRPDHGDGRVAHGALLLVPAAPLGE